MKNKILSILFGAIMILSVLSCGTSKETTSEMIFGGSVQTELIGRQTIKSNEHSLKRQDFNKICSEYRIPTDLGKWKETVLKDFETGVPIKEYVFLKNVDESKATVFDIYRTKLNIVNNDTTFILTHRQTFTK